LGSGGAHETHFKVVDEIIIKLFNLPIEDQPKGILDMGCGNGAFRTCLHRNRKTNVKKNA
jgi:2-polyprenyl-3-methyl-5-hydroxy-6-metoxy-1,4-benzoquinol methylase